MHQPAEPVRHAIEHHDNTRVPHLQLLWAYYRNPMRTPVGRPESHQPRRRRLAQEQGLPERIRSASNAETDTSVKREIVIENDIAWRIHTMVDFMFGRPIIIRSVAQEPDLRRRIERTLDQLWEHSGGIALLQDIGLIGHVAGYVDLAIMPDPQTVARVECIEPTRGIPVLNRHDFRRLDAFLIRHQTGEESARITTLSHDGWQTADTTDTVTTRLDAGPNTISPGRVPVVHIQNMSQPFRYEGLSEVEPLIPLQDELNTRLSDCANRVTLQSFNMYLAKGLDGFEGMPVGPGQVWATDNPEAQVLPFGGDAASPSEDAHIEQIREAMDKISAVPPVASGVVRAKIGNLTSENALRVTLLGLLSKTARKRITYGRGIADASRRLLEALHTSGTLRTRPEDREVRVEWPEPLPRDEATRLNAALRKIELGIAPDVVRAELGYATTDPGVV